MREGWELQKVYTYNYFRQNERLRAVITSLEAKNGKYTKWHAEILNVCKFTVTSANFKDLNSAVDWAEGYIEEAEALS
jgi:hypothetical protein